MATNAKPTTATKKPHRSTRRITTRRDIRHAATVLFLHSKACRDLQRMLTLACRAASQAESLAERIPGLLKDGAFGFMLFPRTSTTEMIRDLTELSYICRTVADGIDSELPANPK